MTTRGSGENSPDDCFSRLACLERMGSERKEAKVTCIKKRRHGSIGIGEGTDLSLDLNIRVWQENQGNSPNLTFEQYLRVDKSSPSLPNLGQIFIGPICV